MDALVDSSSAIARSTSSCVPRPAISSCCVSSDALSWLATLSRATASRACVPLTSVYASTTSAATDTRVRRRSDRSRAKSARAPAMEARRAPKMSTSQLASTPASNRFTSAAGATPTCDRLRSNAAVAPPTGQFVPSCSRSLARASLHQRRRLTDVGASTERLLDERRHARVPERGPPRVDGLRCRECGVRGSRRPRLASVRQA